MVIYLSKPESLYSAPTNDHLSMPISLSPHPGQTIRITGPASAMNERIRARPLRITACLSALTVGTLSQNTNAAENAYRLPTQVVSAKTMDEEQQALYRAFHPDQADLGILGTQRLLETPFSVNVLDSSLITRLGVHDTGDALKYFPSTQMEIRSGDGIGRPQSRGFEGGVVENIHQDGFNIVATTPIPAEMYDRLEVINSLTGPQYGAANPAGNFNYYTKRPTRDYRNTYSFGITQHGRVMNSLDLSGTPSRYIGYRVNLLYEDGKGAAQDSRLRRAQGSIDLDIHPRDGTVIQLHDSVYHWKGMGMPGGFQGYTTYGLPSAMDARRRGYGQKYAGSDNRTNTQSFKVLQDLPGDWKLTAGVLHQDVHRDTNNVTNVLTSPDHYQQKYTRINSKAWRFDVVSNLINLNGSVDTGPIKHHLSFGTNGFTWKTYNGDDRGYEGQQANTVIGSAPINSPKAFDKPDTPSLPHYKSSTARQQNLMIGDTLDFGRHYSLMLNGSRNFFHYTSWNKQGHRTANDSDQGNSGTIAFMYKPTDYLTAYSAYSTSLEIGGIAPSGATNEFQMLAPIRSHQLEFGIKSHVGDIDLNGAVFRVTRPLAYVGDDGTYANQGKQRNYGVELWANGNVTDQLRLMGGVTYLNAELQEAAEKASENQRVVGVPRYQANLLAEYDLTRLRGVTLVGNVHYVGKRAGDPANTTWAGSYTTMDAGVRYVNPNVLGHRVSVNFMVDNLTNENYWAGIFPGSIYGNSSSNYTAFLGTPRTATLTGSVSF